MPEIYVVSSVRTAVGTFGGSLKDESPCELGAAVARDALARANVPPDSVGHVVFGQVIATEPRDYYLARVIAVAAGVPAEIPALTVNRLCGSGLQAVLSAAQCLLLGDAEIVVAGGAEIMSRAPYHLAAVRWGQRLGNTQATDMVLGALTDPFGAMHMGLTAENVASRYGVSREDQDELAVESHSRAGRAIAEGRFASQIMGVEVSRKRERAMFDTDEHVRPDATLADMQKLRPAFRRESGTVTAGNASGINDGAAAVVLATAGAVRAHGLIPLARLVSYGHAGVEPEVMGIGPVPATRIALKRGGLRVQDLDVIESNEAFAAQACAVSRELGFDPERVNPNGSGISIGHPIGATGAINTVKLVHEMRRTDSRYGLVTMCIGGGQGIAAIFERC